MDFSRLYEVSNVVDEHRDMRLDIDSMTYEVWIPAYLGHLSLVLSTAGFI
jgi:hypothetical protein